MARYYSSGRKRFVYSSDATYECPYASGPPWELVKLAHQSGVLRLPEMFQAAHRRSQRVRMRDANDRPTDLCATCGGKLRKVGYRVWVEGRYEDVIAELRRLGREEAATSAEASQRINERLGGDGWTSWPDSDRYFPVKREAIAWCREEAEIERSARREELSKTD